MNTQMNTEALVAAEASASAWRAYLAPKAAAARAARDAARRARADALAARDAARRARADAEAAEWLTYVADEQAAAVAAKAGA
jgi:hypothetical protein